MIETMLSNGMSVSKVVYEESENGKNSKCSYEVFDANCEQA